MPQTNIPAQGESAVDTFSWPEYIACPFSFSETKEGWCLLNFMDPLLALQEIDGRIRELKQEIRDIPTRKGTEKGRLSETTDRLEDAKERYRAAQARIASLENDIAAENEKIRKFRQQQLGLRTNEEFRAMGKQIQDCEKEIESLMQVQMEVQKGLDPLMNTVKTITAKLTEELDGVDANLTELEERQAQAEEMLKQLEEERKEAVAKVPPQHLRTYERLAKSRWPVAVPLENGSVCGGCHLAQPPSSAHLLKRNSILVSCQMCGRLLYSES